MFKKYSIKNRVWRAVMEIVLGIIITVLLISMLSTSFLQLNIVTSHNAGEKYFTTENESVKQIINHIESLGLDYAIFDKETNNVIDGKYTSKEIHLFKEVVNKKTDLFLNTVHYDFYKNKNYYIVIRYNEIPEFSSHFFRNISYNMLTFCLLGLGIIISIIVALTKFVKEITSNFKEIKQVANIMGREGLSEQECYSKIIEFNDILKTLHKKGNDLKNLIEREKSEKQDLSFQIAALSHDIKTPLTVLKGNLELLELTDLSTKQQDYSLSMNNSVSVFEGYFNSLISYTRMLSEESPVKLIAIDELLSGLHFEVEDLLKINKVAYSLNNSLTTTSFYGEESYLIRALSNLLVNAIRFTPLSNKKIEVTLSEENDKIYFEIWNNGQPFSESTLKNGGKLFYTEDYSRGNQHYGIGLAFVNGVAIKHGGSLQLINPARGGASAILSVRNNLL